MPLLIVLCHRNVLPNRYVCMERYVFMFLVGYSVLVFCRMHSVLPPLLRQPLRFLILSTNIWMSIGGLTFFNVVN